MTKLTILSTSTNKNEAFHIYVLHFLRLTICHPIQRKGSQDFSNLPAKQRVILNQQCGFVNQHRYSTNRRRGLQNQHCCFKNKSMTKQVIFKRGKTFLP